MVAFALAPSFSRATLLCACVLLLLRPRCLAAGWASSKSCWRQLACHLRPPPSRAADREGGLSRSQLRLAQQNLLCFVSDLWLGSDGYQIAEARVAAAHAAAQAADGVNGAALKARADALATNLKAREDGPDQDYASFPVFKDYAMASFTVLISSAVVEGFFSQFAGMKDKTRNLMADQTWSWSMWTRMAVPINSEAAEGFDLEPKLKDDARKDRLDWTYK